MQGNHSRIQGACYVSEVTPVRCRLLCPASCSPGRTFPQGTLLPFARSLSGSEQAVREEHLTASPASLELSILIKARAETDQDENGLLSHFWCKMVGQAWVFMSVLSEAHLDEYE